MFSKCVFALFIIGSLISVTQSDNEKFFRNDFVYLEDTKSFYKIHTLPRTWNDAKNNCEWEGATLFYPQDEDEAAAVINHWNQTQPYMNYVFIGVADWIVKHVFDTVDGKPVSDVYDNWDYGEPNNAGGDEGCVVLNKEGKLNDDNCGRKFPFICKKSFGTLQWNTKCDMPDQQYKYSETHGRCYKFHLTPMSWTEAYTVCHAEQSYLAVINSEAEAALLVNITANAPTDTIKGDYLSGAVHLGFQKKNGYWITIQGVPVHYSGYSKWSYAQPDGGSSETCGSMFYNGELNDIGCYQKMFFICEHEVRIRSQDFTYRFNV